MTDPEAKALHACLLGKVHACLDCETWVERIDPLRLVPGRGYEALARCHGETAVRLFTEDDIGTRRFWWFKKSASAMDGVRRDLHVFVHLVTDAHKHAVGETAEKESK